MNAVPVDRDAIGKQEVNMSKLNIKVNTVISFTIIDTSVHDPITVFMRDMGPARGELTVVCWGRAWSCFFGAMGNGCDLSQFIRSCSSEYFANKMLQREIISQKKILERDRAYLEKIIDDVKAALKQRAGGA